MQSHFWKKRCIIVAVFAVVVIAALLCALSYAFREKELYQVDERFRVDTLLDYSTEYFGNPSGGIGKNTEVKDALRSCPAIIEVLRRSDPSAWTEELLAPIHILMDLFYEYGYLPREPAETIGDYVTSMDAPLLAVSAELAYERGLGEEYRQYMEDLIPYIVSSTKENGFVLKYSKTEWWPLEYAWTTVTEKDAHFVLNGSLYGMVYIEMLKNLTGDPRLAELSEKTLNGYKAKADSFFYPDGTWCYYSLLNVDGKKTINWIPKLAIEVDTLRALYLLTEEPFYNEQLEIRLQLMANILPVYIVKDGDTNTAMLLRACAPHPYEVDIYSSFLEFLDADGNVVTFAEAKNRLVENAYILTEVPESVASYRLYRIYSSGHPDHGEPADIRLWAKGPVKYIEKSELVTTPTPGDWSFAYDSVSLENGKLLLNPDAAERQYGTITYKLDEGQPYTTESYWVMEIDNPTEKTMAMRSDLYDENGTVITRTLASCKPGKNVLVYSPLGYKDHDWPLDKVAAVSVIIITNGLEEPIELGLGDIYYFHRTADVVNYLSQYEFSDFWVINE